MLEVILPEIDAATAVEEKQITPALAKKNLKTQKDTFFKLSISINQNGTDLNKAFLKPEENSTTRMTYYSFQFKKDIVFLTSSGDTLQFIAQT
jgi:hypothetical protein